MDAPPEELTSGATLAQPESAEAGSTDDEEKPVVRLLAVGQQVSGVVKRVSDFGAFVDIGVGRDGLVHISELSPRRVAKVTDVLQQGQEATFWIKKLDRDRNRISLTMIEPGTKTIRNMDKGDIVQGTVTRIMPYGAFVDIGIGRDALLHVREMGERFIAKPEDVVQVGELIDARILDISRRRARVDLSIKGLRPEPEPEPAPEPERNTTPEPEPEPEAADPFEDMEVLSPIEAALRKAMKESGAKLNLRKDNDRRSKKNESARARAMQEELLARTLSSNK
jgi:transcriptional accessory protein Tex/SPT6